jgi:hypothetical protein
MSQKIYIRPFAPHNLIPVFCVLTHSAKVIRAQPRMAISALRHRETNPPSPVGHSNQINSPMMIDTKPPSEVNRVWGRRSA